MEVQLDYRNAKYQGEVDLTGSTRKGFGILIDDDLSFYASQWKEGKLNGPTVIYMSHGKYIYGQWSNNQPHGLNVFRIADTVIVGEFNNGVIIKKALIIFEKCNFVAILSQSTLHDQWRVTESGTLRNYEDLLGYIDQAQIPMKSQYFSLTKFLTSISNNMAAATPCRGSENCYFGFQNGLGIVFNPNNGVVSVGVHENKKLVEFGGKYEIPSFVIEGNFQTNDIIKYSKERPKSQIYSIFQKMHKRSLNFKNEYFDSKVKLLTSVEELVRGKIDEIINKKHENTFTALDLNDSLDYHADNLEEINRINQIREEVYESIHIPMKKATSAYQEGSPISQNKDRTPLLTPKTPKKNYILNAPPSPVLMKKSPFKNKQKSKGKTSQKQSMISNKSRVMNQPSFSSRSLLIKKTQIEQSPMPVQVPSTLQYKNNYSENKLSENRQMDVKYSQKLKGSMRLKYLAEEQDGNFSPIQHLQTEHKQKYAKKELRIQTPIVNDFEANEDITLGVSENVRESKKNSYENIDKNFYKKLEERSDRPFERSPIKGPNYQDLSNRRKRLLKQFKNLNASQKNIAEPKLNQNIKNINPSSRSNKYQENEKISALESQYSSPLAQQKFISYQSKNTEQNSEMMPLSIRNQNRLTSHSPLNNHQKNTTAKFIFNYETPEKQTHKYQREERTKSNIEQMMIKERPFEKKQSYQDESEKKQLYRDIGEKKKSYIDEGERMASITPTSRTPAKKKEYKYYFD